MTGPAVDVGRPPTPTPTRRTWRHGGYGCAMRPIATLDACRASHQLLLDQPMPLTGDHFRVPSLLPRYSRGPW
jgi:hypothetical protein